VENVAPVPQPGEAATPRTLRTNATVAILLGGIAGALNAGGFFAVGVYTSHITGAWSKVGDELVLGHTGIAAKAASLVVAFFAGALTSSFLIESGTSSRRRLRYLKPLVLQIFLLGAFVVLGKLVESEKWVAPYLTMVLGFSMGLQNAMATKISGGVVRTTHMTGVVTDIGIEIARLGLLVRDRFRDRGSMESLGDVLFESYRTVAREGQKAALLACIFGSFLLGAMGGAVSFLSWGYAGATPIAAVLAFLVAFEIVLIRRPDVASSPLTGPRTLQFEPDRLAEPNPFAALVEPSAPSAPPTVEPAPPAGATAPPGKAAAKRPSARRFRSSELGPIEPQAATPDAPPPDAPPEETKS
jgi:uncharacterized membrane protein YoaK (UPF0700 family)